MIQLSVIIPTFSDPKNINALYEQIQSVLKGISHEIIFIDDSPMHTLAPVKKLVDENKNVKLFHRSDKGGRVGFRQLQGKYAAVIDADLRHPPKMLRAMYAVVSNGFDVCIPSRYIPGGSENGSDSYRKAAGFTAKYLNKAVLRSMREISDPTSGLFMFRREIVSDLDLRPESWMIMMEVLAMGEFNIICEIPLTFSLINSGPFKLSAKMTQDYFSNLVRLTTHENKHNKLKVVRMTVVQVRKYIQELDQR